MLGFILGLTVTLFLPAKNSPPTVELDELPEPYYSVLWENEHVRIVEHSMMPGDSEPMERPTKLL